MTTPDVVADMAARMRRALAELGFSTPDPGPMPAELQVGMFIGMLAALADSYAANMGPEAARMMASARAMTAARLAAPDN